MILLDTCVEFNDFSVKTIQFTCTTCTDKIKVLKALKKKTDKLTHFHSSFTGKLILYVAVYILISADLCCLRLLILKII
jgi:hypothetical protein